MRRPPGGGWALRWASVDRMREVVAMGAEEGTAVPSEVGLRRAQSVSRSQRRRRRPNITGVKHTVEVVLSEEEMAVVRKRAEEANCTVPWFLVQCATDPEPEQGKTLDGAEDRLPRMPLAMFRAVVRALMSATAALDEVRRQELAPLGNNVNQMTRAANVTGQLAEEVLETLGEVREVTTEVRERAERIEQMAARVARR
ncbi:MobC family plasmid mobilization relaxosome protein [Nocardia sp. NPDC051570]|uniref:MobC family plasmid mobilization relaxosome protein n=1 Tax=Nocardia sp. NPDC051570 TaxID=3364324 RepID=UPI0037AB31EE